MSTLASAIGVVSVFGLLIDAQRLPHRRELRSGALRPADPATRYLRLMWPTIWTVGHSVRALDEFLAVLATYDIELVADVRRFPGSRRLPCYGAAELEASLAAAGVAYQWLPALGGRRRLDPASQSSGWRHPAFRAYADYVSTEEFASGLFELLLAAQGLRTAVMCAEILWWRCHRRIIADVLASLGVSVVHIRDAHTAEAHRLAPPARIVGGRLTYALPARRDAVTGIILRK